MEEIIIISINNNKSFQLKGELNLEELKTFIKKEFLLQKRDITIDLYNQDFSKRIQTLTDLINLKQKDGNNSTHIIKINFRVSEQNIKEVNPMEQMQEIKLKQQKEIESVEEKINQLKQTYEILNFDDGNNNIKLNKDLIDHLKKDVIKEIKATISEGFKKEMEKIEEFGNDINDKIINKPKEEYNQKENLKPLDEFKKKEINYYENELNKSKHKNEGIKED